MYDQSHQFNANSSLTVHLPTKSAHQFNCTLVPIPSTHCFHCIVSYRIISPYLSSTSHYNHTNQLDSSYCAIILNDNIIQQIQYRAGIMALLD